MDSHEIDRKTFKKKKSEYRITMEKKEFENINEQQNNIIQTYCWPDQTAFPPMIQFSSEGYPVLYQFW